MRCLGILILVLLGMAAQAKEEKQVTRTWKVPADFTEVLALQCQRDDGGGTDPFEGLFDAEDEDWRPGPGQLAFVLGRAGLNLAPDQVEFSPWTGVLKLSGTLEELTRFDAIYQKLGPLPQFVIDPALLQRSADPKADARRASEARIEKKLESIILR